jgi:small-conductance mechanosensitive channel
MHRLLNVLVVLATLGAALMVFDSVRSFGASLLTSAGILGLVAGIAAQRTLQNVFAGLQLAITQPIALGDVVEVENVVGTVEEITFSFVSVRLRDLRRLILPVTYFLERPFTNWTRTSAESLTSFSLVLALGASLPAIRRQVESILGPPTTVDTKDFALLKKTIYVYAQGKDSVTIVFKDDKVQAKDSTLAR